MREGIPELQISMNAHCLKLSANNSMFVNPQLSVFVDIPGNYSEGEVPVVAGFSSGFFVFL